MGLCEKKTTKSLLKYVLFTVVGVALLFTGCGKTETDAPLQVEVTALAAELQQALGLEAELSAIDFDTFYYLYDVKPEQVAALDCRISTGATADEICVLEAASEGDKKDITEKISARLEKQKESFAGYLPMEVGKIEQALVVEKDNYVVLVVTDRPDTAREMIDNAFGAKATVK